MRFLYHFALVSTIVLCESVSAQTVTIVHDFDQANGYSPDFVNLVQGRDGKLYGTTYAGGVYQQGTIFRQTTNGRYVVIHNFNGADGANPSGGVTLARDNHFYGTTTFGGTLGAGVLFKIDAAGTYTILHEFAFGADGAFPLSSPVEGSDGNVYGIVTGDNFNIFPSVYKMTPDGVFSTIYFFSMPSDPFGTLLQGSDGYLYATTPVGGIDECGSVIKMTNAGREKWIYSFPCQQPLTNGPMAGLIQGNDGNYYGTTENQGLYSSGSVYKIDGKTGDVSTIHSFSAAEDRTPLSPLVQGTDGNLYGTTPGFNSQGGEIGGAIYQVTMGGTDTHIYRFDSTTWALQGGLVQHTNGSFYGVTATGGTDNQGTLFKLDMGLAPFMTFVRAQGHVGATAQILGQGLTGTTSVTFNGVSATTFTVVSGTYMTAVVPSGATTGKVVVTTPGGALTSNVNFRIIQ
jgi:uncharacterized repeat protein (TIGR03803 family)